MVGQGRTIQLFNPGETSLSGEFIFILADQGMHLLFQTALLAFQVVHLEDEPTGLVLFEAQLGFALYYRFFGFG